MEEEEEDEPEPPEPFEYTEDQIEAELDHQRAIQIL